MDTRAAPAAVHMNRLKLHRAERSSFKMDWGTVETDLRSDPSTHGLCGWVCGRGSIRPVELAAGTSGQAPSVLKAIHRYLHRYQSSICSVQTCFSDAAFMFEWDDAKAQNASVAPAACSPDLWPAAQFHAMVNFCIWNVWYVHWKHSWCKVGVSHSPLPLVGLEDHGGLCLPNICTSLRSIPGLSRCSAVRRGDEGHTWTMHDLCEDL